MWDFFENIKRLYFFDPPLHILPSEDLKGKDKFAFEKQLKALLYKPHDGPIFVLAPFGAGKTTHLRSFMKENGNSRVFFYQSFFSVSKLDEAYVKLLPLRDRIVSLVVFLGLILSFKYFVPDNDGNSSFNLVSSSTSLVSLFLSYLFLSNKKRIWFILGNTISNFFRPWLYRVVIIDDLDRSSMKRSDWWALLSNLWIYRCKYIVALGFKTEPERLDLLEVISKLGGSLIELPLNAHVTQKIMLDMDPAFPFKPLDNPAEDWMKELPPRRISATKSEVDHFDEKSQLKRSMLYIYFCFNALKEELLTEEHRDHVVPQTNASPFQVYIPSARGGDLVSTKAAKLLRAFPRTISDEFILEVQEKVTASGIVTGQAPPLFDYFLRTPPDKWKAKFPEN